MNTQAPSPSIRYSAPADTGLQIAVEFLKVLCIILGVAATPLLLKLFANEQFATFAPWFWAVGAIMGFILVLFGGIYSLVQGRRRRQYREMYSPRQLLLDRLLPPFQIVVSTRAQPVENQAPASTDVQMQFGFLQSRLSGQVVDELLPPLGFHLFPDPLQPRYISLVTQSAYQKKLDALKIMHQTGEITDADYEEKVQSLQHTSPQHTAQKLKALQAMRDAGLMSRSAYKSRVKEIKHAASENNELAQKSWLLLPALLIAIGGFILLFALVAF